MECICGYSYAKALLQKPKAYKSYALIEDTQYRKFLRAEMKAEASKSLKDIAGIEVCGNTVPMSGLWSRLCALAGQRSAALLFGPR